MGVSVVEERVTSLMLPTKVTPQSYRYNFFFGATIVITATVLLGLKIKKEQKRQMPVASV